MQVVQQREKNNILAPLSQMQNRKKKILIEIN
jgi:hypothetical protein